MKFLPFPPHGGTAFYQDSIELLDGTKLTGQTVPIRKADQGLEFRQSADDQPNINAYRYELTHAATYHGKHVVITAKDSSAGASTLGLLKSLPIASSTSPMGFSLMPPRA